MIWGFIILSIAVVFAAMIIGEQLEYIGDALRNDDD